MAARGSTCFQDSVYAEEENSSQNVTSPLRRS